MITVAIVVISNYVLNKGWTKQKIASFGWNQVGFIAIVIVICAGTYWVVENKIRPLEKQTEIAKEQTKAIQAGIDSLYVKIEEAKTNLSDKFVPPEVLED